MLHKLKAAMGTRDSRYKVSSMVEVNEGFFSTETPGKDKDKPLKRGRGRLVNGGCCCLQK